MSGVKEALEALLDFKGKKVKEFCLQRLGRGEKAYDILQELNQGLEEIGKGYENKEFRRYFESDLIVSGANMKRAVELLRPHLSGGERTVKRGRILLGTVKGDVHDIGKTVLSILLQSSGFEVVDLGVDVDKGAFVKGVKEHHPQLVGMSALLTSTAPYMEEVVGELVREGVRERVKVIVGGRAVTEEFARRIGADAYARDAVEGVKKCLELVGG
ncbi:MAG: cobalamin-dependent protein [Candidatus Hadarchaeales archaeon]